MNFYNAENGHKIRFSRQAIKMFESYQQLDEDTLEVGGQLFLQLPADGFDYIRFATGPGPGQKATRTTLERSREYDQAVIDDMYAKDYHYAGDWHTHPEAVPIPSSVDIKSSKECFKQSKHDRNGILMVIVGTSPPPEGLSIWLIEGGISTRYLDRRVIRS